MKNAFASLIIGGAILISGLAVAWVSNLPGTVKEVPKSISLINGTAIEPNLSKALTLENVTTGNVLLVTMSINPSDIPFEAEIRGPSENLLSLFSPVENPFATTIVTQSSGDYSLIITNIGSRPASVNAGMIISEAVISGLVILELTLVLVITGIGFLIFGGIRFALQRKKAERKQTSN